MTHAESRVRTALRRRTAVRRLRTARASSIVSGMRAVIQRAGRASVAVDGEVVGEIERGLVVFLGAHSDDTEEDLAYVVRKIVELRVFPDEHGKMSKCVGDIGGAVLLVSQFTLFGDVRRGNRPSFTDAMAPEGARRMLERAHILLATRIPTETGRFGADMRVTVENDGPVTILIDSQSR